MRGRESTSGEPGKKACARSSMTSVRMKKSNASSVQPRNPARTALRWLAAPVASAVATVMRAEGYQRGAIMRPRPNQKELSVTRTTRRCSLVDLVLIVVAGPAAAQSRRMDLDDLGRVVRVSDPQIAPDGKTVVVVVSRANYDDNRHKADLVMVDVAGGAPRVLTRDRRGVSQPRFSAKGDRIAFLASVPAGAAQQPRSQIFVMPLDGGDTYRVTNAAKGIQQYAWSPDGRSFAFVTENDRAEGYPTFSPDGGSIAYWQPRDLDPGNVNEIHVAPARGGAGHSITRALDRNIARSIWMPGGKTLLVGANDGTRVSLWIQPLDGAPRKLTLGAVSPPSAFWVDVAVASSGAIAFTGSDTTRPAELYYIASADAPPHRLAEFNSEVTGL